MRSLTEKALGAPQTFRVNSNVFVHMPESADEYKRFRAIAGVFGTLPERNRFVISTPTRLAVRDVQLTPESREELKKMRADLPFTEIKWEAAIDRVTSAAAPRQIERVPAGAVFGPAELVFSVYTGDDETAGEVAELFLHVVNALGHLEDDYLGGMGSRGNGQVKLKQISISARLVQGPTYADEKHFGDALDDLRAIDHDKLKDWLTETFVG
jgi:CRISPR-associated protein Csm3